jgi:SAM-dependent methyltransferase
MKDSAHLPWSYDIIAEIYNVDMGRNLPFDDVRFYLDQCRANPGPVLELGCGTGRVLRPLARAGIEVFGIDRSVPMLEQLVLDAREDPQRLRIAVMDARRLGFRPTFQTILMPFSMITYIVAADDLHAVFAECRNALESGGLLFIDAFIPRDMSAFADYRQDYRRPHKGQWLERHRRVTSVGDGTNIIEREYRLVGDAGVSAAWATTDRIRPYTVGELMDAAAAHGLRAVSTTYDYGATARAETAQFATVCFVGN